MPEKEALRFMIDILNGFIQLIKNGIIHRDLKPANILIDKGVNHSHNIRYTNWLILDSPNV